MAICTVSVIGISFAVFTVFVMAFLVWKHTKYEDWYGKDQFEYKDWRK